MNKLLDQDVNLPNVTGRAENWFDNEHEFRQLCGDAQSLATSEMAQDFTAEMVIKSKEYGLRCFLTYNQLKWLCVLADWEVPKRRTK